MKEVFGAPVFYSTEALIKHAVSNNDMDQYNWAETPTDIYEKSWMNQQGSHLYIEDATQILSPTEQTNLSDFDEERYRILEQPRFKPEASLQETFDELDDALDYVEETYNIETG